MLRHNAATALERQYIHIHREQSSVVINIFVTNLPPSEEMKIVVHEKLYLPIWVFSFAS